MSPRSAALSIVVALVVGVMTSAARVSPGLQSPRNPPQAEDLSAKVIARFEEWVAAVRGHEPGEIDAPLWAAAGFSRAELFQIGSGMSRLVKAADRDFGEATRRCAASPNRAGRPPAPQTGACGFIVKAVALGLAERHALDRVIKRGAVLHADVVMLTPDGSFEAPGFELPDEPTRVWVDDGRQHHVDASPVHWGFARRLLDLVRPDPGRDEVARFWYQATVAYVQSQARFGEATLQLVDARRLFPKDATILFYSGVVNEALAGPGVQNAVPLLSLPAGRRLDVESAPVHLSRAEAFFRRALENEPDHVAARLHHGRVLGLLGRHQEAARALQDARDAATDQNQEYYASLFLGREEEALGHRDLARASFERAAALYPRAQSPLLGLSHLARRFGDRSGALEAIRRLMQLPSDEQARLDPWWMYHATSHASQAETLLARLYRSVAAEPPG